MVILALREAWWWLVVCTYRVSTGYEVATVQPGNASSMWCWGVNKSRCLNQIVIDP